MSFSVSDQPAGRTTAPVVAVVACVVEVAVEVLVVAWEVVVALVVAAVEDPELQDTAGITIAAMATTPMRRLSIFFLPIFASP